MGRGVALPLRYLIIVRPNCRRVVGFRPLEFFHQSTLSGRSGSLTTSVADPDPVGSGPFSRIRIRSNFQDPVPDPDPTIKSHITNLIS